MTTVDSGHWLPDADRDSCVLIVSIRKGGSPTHGNVKRTLEALLKMGHRTGEVNGEGHGCGLMTDIPRELWAACLEADERPGALAARASRGGFAFECMTPGRARVQVGL